MTVFDDELLCLLDSGANVSIFCSLPVSFKGVTKSILFYVVPTLTQEGYLGVNFWSAYALAPHIIPEILCIEHIPNSDSLFHKINSEQRLQLESTILKFPSYEKVGLGCTHLLEHLIDTGDAVPVKSKHYPLSPPRQAEVYGELEGLLALGVIEESNSPWCHRSQTGQDKVMS